MILSRRVTRSTQLLRGGDAVGVALRCGASSETSRSVTRVAVADRGTAVLNDIVTLLLPGSGLDPLRVLPGTSVRQLTAALALAGTTELLGQVLLRDLSEQLLLVTTAENVDLCDGDGVEELLDHAEDRREAPGSVDQVQLAHALRVVVLRDGRCLLHVSVNAANVAETDALEIHDGARGFEEVARLARAGGQTGVGNLLVLDNQVLQHAVLGGDLVHGGEVDLAELLDVKGAAVLCRCQFVMGQWMHS
jgi:hypothetical protein